jgi:hypothetical protein
MDKRNALGAERADQIDLMSASKCVFEPYLVMNPGKVLPDTLARSGL